jgi:ankyrin repeat protein
VVGDSKQRLVSIAMIVVFLPFLIAGRDYYVKVDDSCPSQSVYKVDPPKTLKENLDQKSAGVCYGAAAYYSLQYLYDFYNKNNKDKLSFIDVLGKGCLQEFRDGGDAYAVLQNLKNEKISINKEYDLESVFDMSDELSTICSPSSCCSKVPAKFGIQEKNLIKNWEKIAQEFELNDKKTALYKTLFDLEKNTKKVKTPDYNVSVFEPDENGSNSEKQVQEEIRKLLEPIDFYGDGHLASFPAILSFCPGEGDNGMCLGSHAVAVTGVKKVCCKKDDCVDAWYIHNSYGSSDSPEDNLNGWYSAKDLSESLVKHKKNITSIRPCFSDPSLKRDLGNNDEKKCKTGIIGKYPIHYAVNTLNLDNLKSLGDKVFKKNLNASDSRGDKPLRIAIQKGNIEIVKYLLDKGASLEVADSHGNTPLHIAVGVKNIEIVKYLLDKRANLEAAGPNGKPPLYTAIEMGNIETVKYLLDRGARLDVTDSNGNTPLHIAVALKNIEIVKHLLDKGASLEAGGPKGIVPLHLAVASKNMEIAKLLLDRRASLESADSSGNTPLHFAVMVNQAEIVELLLGKGAKKDSKNSRNNTPLAIAVDKKYENIVEIFKRH